MFAVLSVHQILHTSLHTSYRMFNVTNTSVRNSPCLAVFRQIYSRVKKTLGHGGSDGLHIVSKSVLSYKNENQSQDKLVKFRENARNFPESGCVLRKR